MGLVLWSKALCNRATKYCNNQNLLDVKAKQKLSLQDYISGPPSLEIKFSYNFQVIIAL